MEENLVPGRDGEDTKKRQKTSLRYKLNSYHSIMKLAVVFLCLGISCLVDANAGNPKPWKMTGADAHDLASNLYYICRAADKAKTCPERERKATQLRVIQDIVSILTTISIRLDCTLGDILSLLGFSSEAIELVLAGDFLGVLEEIDLEGVLESTLLLAEGIFANAGYLLQSVFQEIHNALGLGSSLPSSLSILSGSIDGILFSLRSTAIGNFLASVSAALGGILGGLSGGVGGNAGGSGLTGGLY